MASKAQLSDLLSKLSLGSENEDHLTFYLTTLRRKKVSYLFSKNALFIQDLNSNQWVYLQLRMIKDTYVWGCSACTDMNTFEKIKEPRIILENYCIHSQVAFMLLNKNELDKKYDEKKEDVEVLMEKPYYAIAHVGKAPAVIHFPRQTKSANCSQHPGAHKAGKSRCEHLVAHGQKNKVENAIEKDQNGDDLTLKTKIKPCDSEESGEKRKDNPYMIKVNLIQTKAEQEKYNDINFKFPENLVPNPENKSCEHGFQYCSRKSAIDRYLIMSDKVHIHDILPVHDSRNRVCRVYYLDTKSSGFAEPACNCILPYTGEDDLLLPISTAGKNHNKEKGRTYNVVSYRMLFDFFLLEMTEGCSASGYISAFNKRRRILCGSSAKECPKKVWLQAVGDFENALTTKEKEAFTCDRCPSEDSPGDGLDEVHIGDGICEGMQVDLGYQSIQGES